MVVVVAEGGDSEQNLVGDHTVSFRCPELTHEGQWHHLAAVVHKASIMKNSSVSLFIDGNYIATQKVTSCFLISNRNCRDWLSLVLSITVMAFPFSSENRNIVYFQFFLYKSYFNKFSGFCLSDRLFVHLSVHHTRALYQNSWTYHQNSFTIR